MSISGQFRLLPCTDVVSAVYSIDRKPQREFSKPVMLELQHCASPSQTSNLSFAECFQITLPHTDLKLSKEENLIAHIIIIIIIIIIITTISICNSMVLSAIWG